MEKSSEKKAVEEIRVFVCEIVERAKSGHPGGPLGCAPVLHVLYSRVLRVCKEEPKWMGRDIFVMSNGHCCGILYLELYLVGMIELEELLRFRRIGSKTPGHPEFSECIEATTGPLGQGVAQSVGYAMALKQMRRFNREGMALFENRVFCLVGDGCMQEGVSQEAFSLAGHLRLNNLVVVYDYNKITIDGSLELSSSDDVVRRMESLGFEVREVADAENLEEIEEKITRESELPVFVVVNTKIGKGSAREGSEKAHGAALGEADIAEMKKKYGIQGEMYISEGTREIYRAQSEKNRKIYQKWKKTLEEYKNRYPKEYEQLTEKKTAEEVLRSVCAKEGAREEIEKKKATREHLSWVLSEVGKCERVFGGSADLSPSNLTKWSGAEVFGRGCYTGRYVHFGIREHGMCGALNGIGAYGWHRAFGSTFLNFVTYAFPAVRIAAISSYPVAVFATHDSIGLGEDGPTHQPIETLALLRATPSLVVLRPADGKETVFSVVYALFGSKSPTVVSLTRQKVPNIEGSSVEGCRKGGYVVSDYGYEKREGRARVLIIGTGSEVSLALDVKEEIRKRWEGAGVCEVDVRVVSLVSFEIFEEQAEAYRKDVLESEYSFSVEASASFGWSKYSEVHFGIDRFGASAPGPDVYSHFELVPDKIAQKIMEHVRRCRMGGVGKSV